MKPFILCLMIFLSILSAGSIHAEPAEETLIGTITLPKNNATDAKSRKEITAIAHKIKKARKSGSVRIVGSVPAASSQEDFISKSVFIARNVETQLRQNLPQSFQIYVTAAKFTGSDSSGKSAITVYLYPYELVPQGAKFISTDIGHAQTLLPASPTQPSVDHAQPATAAGQPAGSLLTPPRYEDDNQVTRSTSERKPVEQEDATKAEELVMKAKARAAKKARQLESQ